MDLKTKEKFVKANALMLALLYDYQEGIKKVGVKVHPDLDETCGNAIAIVAQSIEKLIKEDDTLEQRIDSYIKMYLGESDEKAE